MMETTARRLEGRRVGLVEDDPIMGESLVQSLTLEGSRVDWWKTKSEAHDALRGARHDLVICDMRLPDGRGDELFLELSSNKSLPPFLFVTAFGNIDQAVAVMRAGAGDYVTKPFDVASFVERVRTMIDRSSVHSGESVLGRSDEMQTIETSLHRIADSPNPVLFAGETGTGKEVCARHMHSLSSRSKEPFFAVNCAAIPADVMERELFGHRGSNSGAFHHGFVERAKSGVLFLDEVSELALPLQAKILRLVETREYHRVSGEQLMKFNGRIVCSTNRDLSVLIGQQKFRSDLFYRINAVTVEVPPLRTRGSDIPFLIEQFLTQAIRPDDIVPRGLSSHAWDAVMAYAWPGNVRELRNRILRAAALTKTEWIMPSDLFPDLVTQRPSADQTATLAEARDQAERRQIEIALKQTNGQIIEAADLLGVSRTTLWDKMRKLKIALK